MSRAIAIIIFLAPCAACALNPWELYAAYPTTQSATGSTNFGAWFHLDASAADSITIAAAGGTNYVARIDDWRKNGLYAQQTNAAYRPWIEAAPTNARRQVIDFGPLFNVFDGRWLEFSAEATKIQTVFLVWLKYPQNGNPTYLGHSSAYDFWAENNDLLHGHLTSSAITNGTVIINGSVSAYRYPILRGRFENISIHATGAVLRASNLARDRGGYRAGQKLAEIMIFTNSVATNTASEIRAYLKNKWGTL